MITADQKKAAEYLRKMLTADGRDFTEGGSTKNIIIYIDDGERRYVIQPRTIRFEKRYEVPATQYSPKSFGWTRIRSYTTAFGNKPLIVRP